MTAQYQLRAALDALHAGIAELRRSDPDASLPELPQETEAVKDAVLAVAFEARRAEAYAEACAAMIGDLNRRYSRFEARKVRLRALVLAALETLEERKIEGAAITISKRAGKLRLIIPDNPDDVPPEYRTTTISVDKMKIREDHAQGVMICGVTVTNGPPVLTIRSM